MDRNVTLASAARAPRLSVAARREPESLGLRRRVTQDTNRLFWSAQISGWILIALFGFVARRLTFDDLAIALALTLVLESLGFLMTTAVHFLFLSRRIRITTPPVIAAMACFAVLGGLLQMEVAAYIRDTFFADARQMNDSAAPVVFYIAVLCGWTLAYFWLRADIEARSERTWRSEAQADAMRAELEQLHLQLAPHFLFNALNSVASEIHDRPDAALEMVRRIAAYLRYCLDQKPHSVCRVSEELEAMRSYMRIQELRFEDRLCTTVEVEPGVRDVLIPHMILQGLVENAVKHGLTQGQGSIEIRVAARRRDADTIEIAVTNSGTLRQAAKEASAIGLANTRRRLKFHYPQGYDLTLEQVAGTVVARVTLKGSACLV